MKLKKLIAVVLALVLAFSLCSCGKMTAEKLIAGMAKALAEVDSFAGTMNTGMEMGISLLGESMVMYMTMDAEVSYSDKTTYTKGTITTAMTGQDDTVVETEGYSVTDGDAITTYSLTDGKWTKMQTSRPKVETSLDTVKLLIDPENLGKIVLQEELDTYNSREVYVLTIADCNYPEMAEDYINSQMGSVFGDMDISEIDLSGIVMQVTLKVYKDTKLPAVLTIDFGDSITTVMDSMMDVMLGALAGSVEGLEGIDIGAVFEMLNISFEIPAAMTTVTFDEYNIEPIIIPDEALNADEIFSNGTGILGNLLGTEDVASYYTPEEEKNEFEIPPGARIIYSDFKGQKAGVYDIPGYTVVEESTDDYGVYYVYSTDRLFQSYYYWVTYIYYDGDMVDIVERNVTSYKNNLKKSGDINIVVSDVLTTDIGGYEVTYAEINYTDYETSCPCRGIMAMVEYDDFCGVFINCYVSTWGDMDSTEILKTGIEALAD